MDELGGGRDATDAPNELGPILGRIAADWPKVVEVGEGWVQLLQDLDQQLARLAPDYVVHQVKTKFGALSFYAQSSTDPYDYNEEFNELIRAAEWQSTTTCEECGAAARTYVIRMWVWTVCEQHAADKRAVADPTG